MEVRPAARSQDSALGDHSGRRDDQLVGSAFRSAAVDVCQEVSVDIGGGEIVVLDRQRLENFGEERSTGAAMPLGGKFDATLTPAGEHSIARTRHP